MQAGGLTRFAVPDGSEGNRASEQKTALTSCSVPLVEGVVDMTLFAAEPGGRRYRLAGIRGILHHPGYVYFAEPEAGLVSALESSSGHTGSSLVGQPCLHSIRPACAATPDHETHFWPAVTGRRLY